MKKTNILSLLLLLATNLFSQSNIQQPLSINSDGTAPHASALLDLGSTDKGLLLPRMSTAQRTAISSPASGLLVYDNSTSDIWFYRFNWLNLSRPSLIANADYSTRVETETNTDNIEFYLNSQQAMSMVKSQAGVNAYLSFDNGKSNTLLGTYAGDLSTTGERNSVLGYHCLSENTTGSRNVAAGWNTMRNNTSGNSNVAIGYYALFFNSIRSNLVAVGDSALFLNSSGSANVAIGSKALANNSSGSNNAAGGYLASFNNTSGDNNTAFGHRALQNNTTGDNNSAFGRSAYFGSTNLNNTSCIGYLSGGISNVSNRIEIGNTSVSFIGGQVNWGTYSDARIKTQVQENVPGLDFITKLRPVTYHLDIHKQNDMCFRGKKDIEEWKGMYDIEQKQMTGFIAQEVETAAQAVGYDFSGVEKGADEVGLYSVKYAEFVVPLVKAVQEQQKEIEKSKIHISKLEIGNLEIEKLKAENAALKAKLEIQSAQLEKITAALSRAGIILEK